MPLMEMEALKSLFASSTPTPSNTAEEVDLALDLGRRNNEYVLEIKQTKQNYYTLKKKLNFLKPLTNEISIIYYNTFRSDIFEWIFSI